MENITLADLTKIITAVVRSELADFEEKLWIRLNIELDAKFSQFREEIDQGFDTFRSEINARLDTFHDEMDGRFDEVLHAIGEEHQKVVVAIGGHAIELADHRKRIGQLEEQLA